MIRKSRFWVPLAAIGLLWGCASPEEKASKLFSEATSAVEAAQAAEASSFESAYGSYKLAVENLDAIRRDYSTTKAGVLLNDPEAKVGPFTVTSLKAVVLPQFKAKAAAEGDALLCATELARGETDPYRRGILFARIARAYAERKNETQLDATIAAAEDAARQVVMGMNSEAEVHEELVASLAKAGRPDRAEALLAKYRLADSYSAPRQVAEAWAASGNVVKARALLKRINDADTKAQVLQAVAVAHGKQGQTSAAKAAIKEAAAQAANAAPFRGNSLESNTSWRIGFVAAAAALHDGTETRDWLAGSHLAAYATAEQVERIVQDLKATGDSAPALKLLVDDLEMLKQQDPGGDPVLDEVGQVTLLGNVALAQIKLNEAEKGLFNLKQATAITDANFDPNGDSVGNSLGTQQIRRGFSLLLLGNYLAKAGQVAEAKAATQRVVELAEASTGSLYPDGHFDSKHYLIGQAALIYAELGDWQAAIDALKRAGRSEFIVDDLLALDTKRIKATPSASASPGVDVRPLLHALLTAK